MKAIKLMEIVKQVKAIDYTAANRTIEIESVEFDSRKVVPNSLFVPLVGGTTDGHTYIQKAIELGATATLWSQSPETAPSDQIAVIFVDDTLEAFQRLAAYYRQLVNPTVIALTGSNGKTTTKDMLAATLSAKYQVYKTQGNYNNEIGVPYTLLHMPAETEVLVCEMGMSDFKEIEALSQLVQPDMAAITLIGESHLEYLGSREGIAQAKLEILEGLKEGGIFVYPGNEPLIDSQRSQTTKQFKEIRFGLDSAYDVYGFDLKEDQRGTSFYTNIDLEKQAKIPVIGSYNVTNALIALAIASELGVPYQEALEQLSHFKLTKNRLEWLETTQGGRLLNDAYNASPTSMTAVLHTLATADLGVQGRKIAVLGDIRELGDQSEHYHRSLAEAIDPEAIQAVYLFGSEMAYLYDELKKTYSESNLFHEANQHQVLINQLKSNLKPEDLVLVKSSFGTDLLQVVEALTGKKVKD